MKKNWKRIASLFLSVLLLLSMTVTPVMAAEGKAAPTEVKSCTSSGLWTTVMNLEYEDTTWMNAIDGVTVNEEAYKKQLFMVILLQDLLLTQPIPAPFFDFAFTEPLLMVILLQDP